MKGCRVNIEIKLVLILLKHGISSLVGIRRRQKNLNWPNILRWRDWGTNRTTDFCKKELLFFVQVGESDFVQVDHSKRT